MEVSLHLPYEVLRFVVITYFKVCRCLTNLIRMPTVGTELPALEVVHIRKRPAAGAANDKVHVKYGLIAGFVYIYIDPFASYARVPVNFPQHHLTSLIAEIPGSNPKP